MKPSTLTRLRLRVSIDGIEPEIWRLFEVDGSLSLAQLHLALQVVIGWEDTHLHRYFNDDPWVVNNGIPRIGKRARIWVDAWSLQDGDLSGDEEDESATTVSEAMSDGGPLWYLYDFGDHWLHRIELVSSSSDDVSEATLPVQIVAGERRAPFEDSGGVAGYEELIVALADASSPGHRSAASWIASTIGPWGVSDTNDPDLDGARAEIAATFGPAAMDMSGLVEPGGPIVADSPIAEFASELPVSLRSSLRRHLWRTGVLAPTACDDEKMSEISRPFSWLVDRVGIAGLDLTKAGWMPPAVVRDGMTTLGWRDHWVGEANREDLTYPMRELRAVAERLRVIRRVKGRIELVARLRAAIGRPGVLAEHIARNLLRQRMSDGQRVAGILLVLGIADGTIATRRDAERHVLTALTALGYVDHEGRKLDGRSYRPLVEPVLSVLNQLGLWRRWGRRRETPPGEALRAFARLALR